tara:strand:+ start:408 stop:569 length:162 start_codon:yes stop_codon:yes gene_type:complete
MSCLILFFTEAENSYIVFAIQFSNLLALIKVFTNLFVNPKKSENRSNKLNFTP